MAIEMMAPIRKENPLRKIEEFFPDEELAPVYPATTPIIAKLQPHVTTLMMPIRNTAISTITVACSLLKT